MLARRPRTLNFGTLGNLTRADRMGRNTVSVAGLLANSVTADTSRQASRVTAHGGRPLMGSSWRPIHMDKPDT